MTLPWRCVLHCTGSDADPDDAQPASEDDSAPPTARSCSSASSAAPRSSSSASSAAARPLHGCRLADVPAVPHAQGGATPHGAQTSGAKPTSRAKAGQIRDDKNRRANVLSRPAVLPSTGDELDLARTCGASAKAKSLAGDSMYYDAARQYNVGYMNAVAAEAKSGKPMTKKYRGYTTMGMMRKLHEDMAKQRLAGGGGGNKRKRSAGGDAVPQQKRPPRKKRTEPAILRSTDVDSCTVKMTLRDDIHLRNGTCASNTPLEELQKKLKKILEDLERKGV